MKITLQISDGYDFLTLEFFNEFTDVRLNVHREDARGVTTISESGLVELLREKGWLPEIGLHVYVEGAAERNQIKSMKHLWVCKRCLVPREQHIVPPPQEQHD
jgi:hypothetical protein